MASHLPRTCAVVLGNALVEKRSLDEAASAFREAIRLNLEYAEAHCNLGQLLRVQGRFVESLAALRRGHELGSKQREWDYPSAEWVKQAEQLAALDARLVRVLRGEVGPNST